MSYNSIDKVQSVLAEEIFSYAKDKKKAAGRALGTFVEIINFYLLKTWGLEKSVSIEKGLAEYGNPDITHNVEYSLHPVFENYEICLPNDGKTLTTNKIINYLVESGFDSEAFVKSNNTLLKGNILRNACNLATSENAFLVAYLGDWQEKQFVINVSKQLSTPYAIFECKRVGVEEGMKKGPQTIEKAKQGAYVARTLSSLQKIRTENGELHGIIYESDNSFKIKPYDTLIQDIISSNNAELLRRFVLTIGMVSNHGNWFTSESQNKEMKVLAQSYDWLLFLTDKGLADFIELLLLNPEKEYECVKSSFTSSYHSEKIKNQFTKVQMNFEADKALKKFFLENHDMIEGWFNVISPNGKTLNELKQQLYDLQAKDWQKIVNL